MHTYRRKCFPANVRVSLKAPALRIHSLCLSSIALMTSVFIAMSCARHVHVTVLSNSKSQVYQSANFLHRVGCSLPQNTNLSGVSDDVKDFLRTLILPRLWKRSSNVYYWTTHESTFTTETSGAARCKGSRRRRLLLTFGDTINGKGEKNRAKLAENMTAAAIAGNFSDGATAYTLEDIPTSVRKDPIFSSYLNE